MNKKIQFLFAIIIVVLLTGCSKELITDTVTSDTEAKNTGSVTIIPGNSIEDSGIEDIKNHVGQFDITMSGYKGELFIGTSNGRFYATIKFFNWGNGVPQPVTDLKINGDKIYFKRAINTKEDLVRYGGKAFFDQDFYGFFTPDKKTIKGYYRYTGTQDNWEAVKK